MNTNGRQIPRVNADLYNRNRNRFTLEDLAPYAGKQVAFNFDGTQIMAQGADYDALYTRLAELGIDPERVVFEYIPESGDDTWL